MLTGDENPADATGGTSPTLKKMRRLARVAFVLASCLALAGTATAIWWLTSLNGLPDIGDPFDVEAFRLFPCLTSRMPSRFLGTTEKLVADPRRQQMWMQWVTQDDPEFSWSTADPRLRAWADKNREALELFQHGADQLEAARTRPDAASTTWILAT